MKTVVENDLLAKGEAEIRRWRFADALETFERVIEQNPRNAAAFQGAGLALLNLEKYQAAVDMSAKALELDGALSGPHTVLALAYDLLGNKERSKKEAQLALQMNPDSPDALACMGILLVLENRLAEAQGYLERAVQLDPTSYLAHYNLAVVYQGTGDKKLFRQSIILFTLRPDLRNLLMLLYVSTQLHRIYYLLLMGLSAIGGMLTRPEVILVVTALLLVLYVGTGIFIAFGMRKRQLRVLRANVMIGGIFGILGLILYFFVRVGIAVFEILRS